MSLNLDRYVDSAIYFDAFEHTTCEVFRRVLHPGGTLVDVGANIGFFSLLGARLVSATGRVVAFEPNPEVRLRLESASRMNGYERIIDARDCALGEAPGVGHLFVPVHGDPGIASLRTLETPDEQRRYGVRIARLDDELTGDCAVDLLKIDVEGGELAVLRGGRGLCHELRPHVVCEVNQGSARRFGYESRELVRFFMEDVGGYRIHGLTSRTILWDLTVGPGMYDDPRLENWWFQPMEARPLPDQRSP